MVVAAAALTGCGAGSGLDYQPIPGTDWSRAPDLSVYSAMTEFATIAREQEMLCQGFGPESVLVKWERHYGAREDYVRASLVARYGPEAVVEAENDAVATRRVPSLSKLLINPVGCVALNWDPMAAWQGRLSCRAVARHVR